MKLMNETNLVNASCSYTNDRTTEFIQHIIHRMNDATDHCRNNGFWRTNAVRLLGRAHSIAAKQKKAQSTGWRMGEYCGGHVGFVCVVVDGCLGGRWGGTGRDGTRW